MTPSVRVRLTVGCLAVAAAGIVAGVVLATRQDPTQPAARCALPDALIVPGVKTVDASAVRAALRLKGKAAALALEPLEHQWPNDATIQFNYGLALYCAGYPDEAAAAFRAAKKHGRDTLFEMRADEILHPQYFQPSDGLYPLLELVGKHPLLEQGLVLQRQGHERSAERVYARAAKLHPDDDQAQVAAALGRFDEDNLSASFSRLGPLVKRFPKSQSVRYHLGLLLAWTGQRKQAVVEFEHARSLDPDSKLGKLAASFLQGLRTSGSRVSAR
jgi:tetratricopeptide (TPR) repeat protein